jgi:hypothetical protein
MFGIYFASKPKSTYVKMCIINDVMLKLEIEKSKKFFNFQYMQLRTFFVLFVSYCENFLASILDGNTSMTTSITAYETNAIASEKFLNKPSSGNSFIN